MNMISGLAIAAGIGALVALVAGLCAMARDGEVGHLTSEKWMTWRVIWQAIALVFVFVGLVTPAATA